MSLSDFLTPIKYDNLKSSSGFHSSQMGAVLSVYKEDGRFPDLEDVNLAIIGVEDDRSSTNNKGCAHAPDAVREYFYQLAEGSFQSKIADLGNIRAGEWRRFA